MDTSGALGVQPNSVCTTLRHLKRDHPIRGQGRCVKQAGFFAFICLHVCQTAKEQPFSNFVPYWQLDMTTSVDRYIGTKIKSLRLESGETIEALSQKTGMSVEKWQNYERGSIRIKSRDLSVISGVFGAPLKLFFPDFTLDHVPTSDIHTLRQDAMKIINQIDSPEDLMLALSLLRPLTEH